jgi:hypothetical protein
MNRTTFSASILTIALASTAGCKKSDEKAPPATTGSAGKPADETAASATAPAWTTMPMLGLAIELPAPSEVRDASADAPNARLSIGDDSMGVHTVTAVYASSMEAAKAELQKDPNPFKKFTKEQATEGGWHFEYELESMIDKSPLYGVKIRTTIDGKQYECGSNVRDAAIRAAVAKACATLKKAP